MKPERPTKQNKTDASSGLNGSAIDGCLQQGMSFPSRPPSPDPQRSHHPNANSI